ncbi:MFS transporter [Variovorax sp. PBL-E5]|uniref:MFS transporter n=1 Tax=Variovorax sp. PBL-E5 TaxID=434014 RepID=UPI001315B747|nr:MFS transporter [Variovorax sp. PBL-E5]VTU38406.1 putative MFS-type transporter YhjX [Variovorax sp. PBL-E5]
MQRETLPSIETAYSWWLAALTLLIASIGFGAATCVPILLKPLSREWGASTAALALAHTFMLVGAGFGGLVFGRMHDRFGFFPLAVIGALATASGLIAASFAQGIGDLHLAFGLLVGACGQGIFFSPLTAALSQWFDRHRPLAIASAATGQSAGGLLFPPLLRIAARDLGWRAALLGFGIVAGGVLLACALAFRRMPPAGAQQHRAVVVQEWASLTHRMRIGREPHALLMSLGACLGLFNVATFLVMGHITAAGEELGATPAAAAALLSVMLGASLVTRLGTAQWGLRLGRYRVLVAASVLHVAGLLWLSFSGSYAATAIGVALIGLGFGAYLPSYAVLARELFPVSQAGRRIAEIYFLGFVAAGAGTWVGGLLRDAAGDYGLAFRFAVFAGAAGLAALLAQWRALKTV